MKILLLLLFFTVSAYAQDATSAALTACGLKGAQASMTLDKTQHTPAQPGPGKALVYFIQDVDTGSPLINAGLDGAWVGANKNSYFSVSVAPGKHHLCVSVQSSKSQLDRLLQLSPFTAEAGKIYYFRIRFLVSVYMPPHLSLDSINDDQGKYLVALLPRSISHLKKGTL